MLNEVAASSICIRHLHRAQTYYLSLGLRDGYTNAVHTVTIKPIIILSCTCDWETTPSASLLSYKALIIILLVSSYLYIKLNPVCVEGVPSAWSLQQYYIITSLGLALRPLLPSVPPAPFSPWYQPEEHPGCLCFCSPRNAWRLPFFTTAKTILNGKGASTSLWWRFYSTRNRPEHLP